MPATIESVSTTSIAPLNEALRRLPPYVFAELDRLKAAARARGMTLVDLGIGSPDLPIAPGIIDALEGANWSQTEAAEVLRIPLSTLNQKIKRLNIDVKRRGA